MGYDKTILISSREAGGNKRAVKKKFAKKFKKMFGYSPFNKKISARHVSKIINKLNPVYLGWDCTA